MPKPIEVALDTNVLLDLANDDEVVIDCIQTIKKRIPAAVFLVLPTVIQELVDVSEIGEIPPCAQAGLESAQKPSQPMGVLRGELSSRRPRHRGGNRQKNPGERIAAEEEVHDSFVLAESGLRDASILLSNDAHIKNIDQRALKLLFDECDIGCPLIASPRKIVTSFFQKK